MQNSTYTFRFDRQADFNPMMMSFIQTTISKLRSNGGFRASDLVNSLCGLFDGYYYSNLRAEAKRLYGHDILILRDLYAIADTLDEITYDKPSFRNIPNVPVNHQA
tara:strand:- start:1479 stop:1796 length:318 start_codon:yes stop_codon:yes gene_type:complete